MLRGELFERLRSTIKVNNHILAVATGNGMSTQFVMEGGADIILAISAGRIRQMGQSAFIGFFSCLDTNQMVFEYASTEILPVVQDRAVVMGVFAQDPNIPLYDYLKKVKKTGFSGVINYPSIGFFEGDFRNALDDAELGYEKEVEMIRIAHFLDLFTVAYVFDEEQAEQMVQAGADVICVHFGITGGGILGANQVIPMEVAMRKAEKIFEKVDAVSSNVIKIISGGPVQTPIDAQYFYRNTRCEGFLGGSSIERLPVERAMLNTVRAFKSQGDFDEKNIISKVLNGNGNQIDYAEFMLEYIHKNYFKKVRLYDLAVVTHMSGTRLSVLFKEKIGKTFTEYLIDYRMQMAKRYLEVGNQPIKEIGILVGYEDYSQFAKMFKKIYHMTPQECRRKSRVENG